MPQGRHLSRNQRETLELLVEGKTTKQICHALEISRSTLNWRVQKMKRILKLPSKAHVIAWGIQNLPVS